MYKFFYFAFCHFEKATQLTFGIFFFYLYCFYDLYKQVAETLRGNTVYAKTQKHKLLVKLES